MDFSRFITDGKPCAVKVACTVWIGGKSGDCIKGLPININNTPNHPTIEGNLRRWCRQSNYGSRKYLPFVSSDGCKLNVKCF